MIDIIALGLIIVGAVLACIGLGSFLWLLRSGTSSYMFSSDMCGNDIYQEIYSPNRQYKVVVFQRDCGATTGFSTQVSILGATQELSNVSGNILVVDAHPDDANVQVLWKSVQAVEVTYTDGYEVNYQQEVFTDSSRVFEIHYGVIPSE
jgi:hypothetical protein